MNQQSPKTEEDKKKAWITYEEIKDKYPKARANLAILYRDGIGSHKDINKAVTYALKAASEDVLEANHTLATIYFGLFVQQGWPLDYGKQQFYLEKCRDQVAECKYDLGKLHLAKKLLNSDPQKGIKLLRQAAEAGVAPAEERLKLRNLPPYDPIEIQTRLQKLGYPVGAIDGKIGRKTLTAAATFRRDYKLKVGTAIDLQLVRDLRRIAKLIEQKNTVSKRASWSPPAGLMERLRSEREAREVEAASSDLLGGLGNIEELDQ